MLWTPSRHLWVRAGLLSGMLLMFAASLPAQQVSPVVAQYKTKAQARFELENLTLIPASVVLEAVSFTLSEDGKPTYRPLDSHIKLKLSTMSLRIPPKQKRFVFYEVASEQLPAWFVIYSTFGKTVEEEKVNLQFRLPHTVYLRQKEPLQESDVIIRQAEYFPETRQVVVLIENTSPRLGRTQEADARAGRRRKIFGNFPLFPNSRRRLTMEWEEKDPPKEVRFRFEKFSLRSEVISNHHAPPDEPNSTP